MFFRWPKLTKSIIKPNFSRPRYQVQDSRNKFKNQDQEPRSRVKKANEPKYCHPTLKRGQVTHQKVSSSPTPRSLQLEYHQISSISHVYNAYTPSTPVPVWIPSKGSILSPEWIHAITTIMGHPLSSESEKSIQKWILYHAIRDTIDFWLYWDPTDPYDIKLLQEYVGSNGSVVYLPSSTIKRLISLWNYMNLLINKGNLLIRSAMPNIFSKMINGSIWQPMAWREPWSIQEWNTIDLR